MEITVKVNGADRTADVEPRMLLAHLIREEFALSRVDPVCASLVVNGRSIQALPLFDGGFTSLAGREPTPVPGSTGRRPRTLVSPDELDSSRRA